MRFVEKFLSRWRDIIIVNNQYDYEQAMRYGIRPREKLVLIHNGIDPRALDLLPREEARKRLKLPSDRLIAGTIARKDATKGLDYMPPEVIVLDAIPDASRYLLAFDIFVSSSLKEGFSWAILEAMAAGIPVVATKVGAAPEMIEDGISGFLVEPKDSDAIANSIQKLKNSEQLRQELAINARKIVLEKFNLKKMVREVELLF